jgi:ABC-type spermidine/putrescine transport system permease subunit II
VAAFLNSILVALAVVALAVPIGTAAAIVINSVSGGSGPTLYGIMVAPILAPGLVIGISTVLFWNSMGDVVGRTGCPRSRRAAPVDAGAGELHLGLCDASGAGAVAKL